MPTATKAKTTTPPKAGSAKRSGGNDTADRATDLAGQVLEQLRDGGNSAIDAVRSFVGKVDSALPTGDEGPSRGHEIVDSALEMSQELVQKQYEALRGIVDSAGKSLGASKR